MTPSALTQPQRAAGLSAARTSHHIERAGRPHGTVTPFPPTPAAPTQHILTVEFLAPDGRTWSAIGGGNTLAAAIAFARNSCPADTTWQPISWNDLYGD
jgi:hypothetical protein